MKFSFRYIGKVNPDHGVCYYPKNGKEVSISQYQLLVAHTSSPGSSGKTQHQVTTTPAPVLVTSPIHKYFTFPTALPLTQRKTGEVIKSNVFVS